MCSQNGTWQMHQLRHGQYAVTLIKCFYTKNHVNFFFVSVGCMAMHDPIHVVWHTIKLINIECDMKIIVCTCIMYVASVVAVFEFDGLQFTCGDT